MEKDTKAYNDGLNILKRELVAALGCTEPIALAYCACKAATLLGTTPETVCVEVSPNIIKNVKSVIVPNTDGLKGVEAAAAAGIVAGNAAAELEVIEGLSPAQKQKIRGFLACTPIVVKALTSDEKLDILVTVGAGAETATVRIQQHHTNITYEAKNGQVLLDTRGQSGAATATPTQEIDLDMEQIYDFANCVAVAEVAPILDRQIEYNMKIAEEGLKNSWGANIGSTFMARMGQGNDVKTKAIAAAAAASDARMSGCGLPVVINSGSGNQGITVSVPVIVYARELNLPQERLYRALVLSNLTAVHIKRGIGALSAYCGAVSAGCAAASGIAYLLGGDLKVISHTLVNSLAVTSGIICDGAKPSCAAKIAASLDMGLLGYEMYREGQQFVDGEGIVRKGVENTIQNIARLGADGMRETDKVIISMMTGC
ncbi:MAG: L-serine ammonia-lyase, iron-sulfur-dependent, subunit alpha [Gemmiger sp.]|nr:L-serine ammonia-lyase, iron-sulfur-dependent, subunit alpha [Gemmiger sp.]